MSYADVDKVWKMNMKEDERFPTPDCPFSKKLHRYDKGDKEVLSSRGWSARNTFLIETFSGSGYQRFQMLSVSYKLLYDS